uniref:Uncharacterized protein n=1 Tax=Panagrolaimus sp. PS1159 TaxID=55785 RepID=A0AC35FPI5_9BILA
MTPPARLCSSDSETICREFIDNWSYCISLLETNTERDVLNLLNLLENVRGKWQQSEAEAKDYKDKFMVERDSYLNDMTDLRSHLESRNNLLKETVVAKDKLQIELIFHHEQYSRLEQLLQKTQAENSELLKQFEDLKSADTSVDGRNKEIQQLQNKNLYHEIQLTEQRAQLDHNSNEWKIKYEKLEEQLGNIVNDKQKTEEVLNERVNSQMELISQLRITNGRIESDLEYQKKNQETAFKKVNELEKEIAKKNEQIAKHKAQHENDEQRIQQLTNELSHKEDELTKLNVNLRLLNDEYDVARNNAVSYEAQVKVLLENRCSAERTNSTFEGIENILKVKETEKIEQMKSQLDILMIERDNHEKGLTEQRAQLDQLKAQLESKVKELQELQRLTGGFENTMKSQDELQQQQQTRLQQECKDLTNELEAARKTIEELNAKIFDSEARERSHGDTIDTLDTIDAQTAPPSSSPNEEDPEEGAKSGFNMLDASDEMIISQGNFVINKKQGISLSLEGCQYNRYNYDTKFKCSIRLKGKRCASTITTKEYDRETVADGDPAYILQKTDHSCGSF